MSPELTTVLMLLSLFILLAGFPLAFGIGTMGLLFGYLTGGNAFLYMIPQRVINGTLSEYILAAVPLFIFMGAMMGSSGVAERAFTVLQRWMAGLKGGLAVATITLAMMFAACVGVVGASETAIGLLAIPSMLNARYSMALGERRGLRRRHPGDPDPSQRHAHPVCARWPGYPWWTCMRVHSFRAYSWDFPTLSTSSSEPSSTPEMGPSLPKEMSLKFFSRESAVQGVKYLCPPLGLVFLVLGSLFLGVASPTEAGAVGSIGAIAMGLIYRTITWTSFKENCYLTLRITAMIIFIAIASNIFTGAFLERRVRPGHHGSAARSRPGPLGSICRAADHHPDPGVLHRLDRHPHDHGADFCPHPLQPEVRSPVGGAGGLHQPADIVPVPALCILHFLPEGDCTGHPPHRTSTGGSCLSSSFRC